MKKTAKKQAAGLAVETVVSPSAASVHTVSEHASSTAKAEEPLLTPKQLELHQALTSENGFSMEAALRRLAEKQAKTAR